MKLTVSEFKTLKDDLDLDQAPSALEFLKFQMVRLMSDGKYDEAAEVAKTIAEYEAPKLSRVDQSTLNLDTGDLSDEQLQEEMDRMDAKRM